MLKWGEQRASAAEENAVVFFLLYLLEQIAAENAGAAAAAGTAGMDILLFAVKNHHATVIVDVFHRDAVFLKEIQNNSFSD